MNEALLQYIWQHKLFNPMDLKTTSGSDLVVINSGVRNVDEGPDFSAARIKIDAVELVGNVEIHVLKSDWKRHRHQYHKAYEQIVLHVVYENDCNDDLGAFPTVELKDAIKGETIYRYQKMMELEEALPCASALNTVPALTIDSWLERMLIERWTDKNEQWLGLFTYLNHDWKQLLYCMLAYNFGFKVNSAAFLQLAKSMPITILEKHKDNLFQIEALLFGQAGLLPEHPSDSYSTRLVDEYLFLKHKYNLTPIVTPWKFLRLRPRNFPTIRIAQFAYLIHCDMTLFAEVLTCSIKDMRRALSIQTSPYWETHYRFGKETVRLPKKFGAASQMSVFINTVAPYRYLYGQRMDNDDLKESAMNLLGLLKPEQNNRTEKMKKAGFDNRHAAHSQALLHLYGAYCSPKKCLQCSIGHKIIKGA